jgi:hypothetical protein
MKNPATHASQDDFNPFTQWLYNAIKAGDEPKVILRNGEVVKVGWFTEDGDEYAYFCHNDVGGPYVIWYNDGHSLTSADFDMMEIANGEMK